MTFVPSQECLYHVQDDDRPMFVVAKDWQHALDQWRALVRQENNMGKDEAVEPDGIQRLCDANEVLLPSEMDPEPEVDDKTEAYIQDLETALSRANHRLVGSGLVVVPVPKRLS